MFCYVVIGLSVEVLILVQQNKHLKTLYQNLELALTLLALLPDREAKCVTALNFSNRLVLIGYPDVKKTGLGLFSIEYTLCKKSIYF